ncbi:ABC transporter ATP-binding protein [Leucobacter viscericola]|uniref:ABC transporter ATP-binding protein n=1 Tax=Leucobacter viscericola TaxID=2714935 RepID=A0A6G7XJQ8_9MICO|nr:ABC transporter ATP-binding protein [Leucobacter viscericola]
MQSESLVKTFGGRNGIPEVQALRGISLTIASGQMAAIVGPSGCGKSTLLYALSGLERPTAGEVRIEGEDITSMNDERKATLYREAMGFVFQSFNLVPSLKARENIVISDRLAGRRADLARADSILVSLGLAEKGLSEISSLSNGQQQRVALARVLYAQPRIVFADEPTGALDSTNARTVLDQLRSYADLGHTVVMVTHDLEAACRADTVFVMRDGLITHSLMRPSAEQLLALVSEPEARNGK